jgi:hypothetical protein
MKDQQSNINKIKKGISAQTEVTIKARNPDAKLKSIQFQNKCTNSYALKGSYCTIDLPKKAPVLTVHILNVSI